jgi:hypothetical protein
MTAGVCRQQRFFNATTSNIINRATRPAAVTGTAFARWTDAGDGGHGSGTTTILLRDNQPETAA